MPKFWAAAYFLSVYFVFFVHYLIDEKKRKPIRKVKEMKFAKGVVKSRVIILILSIALIVPALLGMIKTRINYDMLTYLPKDFETVKGQDILMDEFGKGAFSFIVVEGMSDKDVKALADKI